MKKMPIKAAKDVAYTYNQDMVIIISHDKTNNITHVVSYGKTLEDCKHAALAANYYKRALGFPEEMCNDVPRRAKKKGTE